MEDDRVTERPNTTVIERRGNGGAILIGLAVLVLVILAGVYMMNQSRNDNLRTDAITGAAKDVGDSATKVGDSAEKAADSATN